MSAEMAEVEEFAASRERFASILGLLESEEAGQLSHGELEERLEAEGRKLLRDLLQDHLTLRRLREQRLQHVIDAQSVGRSHVEIHERKLGTVFGQVVVERLAYRARGRGNLYPADGVLNLPAGKHSHGLRKLAATEASRGSFEAALEAVGRATGQKLGERQVEELAADAAVDFDSFYDERPIESVEPTGARSESCGISRRPCAFR